VLRFLLKVAKVLQFLIFLSEDCYRLEMRQPRIDERRPLFAAVKTSQQSTIEARGRQKYENCYPVLTCYLLTGRLIPNSHRQARPDKTVQNSPVSVVAASAM